MSHDTTDYNIAKAQADAEAAKAAAAKAQADLQAAQTAAATAAREEAEAASPEAVAQRAAEARKAAAEADKAASDAAVAIDPALEREKAEAETRKATAEADQAAATAAQNRVASMLPDFTKLTSQATTLSGDSPIQGSALGQVALRQAALGVADAVRQVVLDDHRPILITTDGDLATADAAYAEVSTGLKALKEAAKPLLPVSSVAAFPIALAGAAAQALPALLTALSPKVTVSTSQLATDATAAVAAVSGALAQGFTKAHGATIPSRMVRIDDFRLVPIGAIAKAEADLRANRDQLARHRSERTAAKATAATKLAEAIALVTAKKEGVAKNPPTATLTELDEAKANQARFEQGVESVQAKIGDLDDVIARIDAFLLAIHSVPSGATRSAFVSAALHEELRGSPTPPPPGPPTSHPAAALPDSAGKSAAPPPPPPPPAGPNDDAPTRSGMAAVVLLKAQSGSLDQTYKDRPIRSDKYEGVGSTLISYIVLDPSTSNVLAAGNEIGSACLTGEIGTVPKVSPVTLGQ